MCSDTFLHESLFCTKGCVDGNDVPAGSAEATIYVSDVITVGQHPMLSPVIRATMLKKACCYREMIFIGFICKMAAFVESEPTSDFYTGEAHGRDTLFHMTLWAGDGVCTKINCVCFAFDKRDDLNACVCACDNFFRILYNPASLTCGIGTIAVCNYCFFLNQCVLSRTKYPTIIGKMMT